MENNSILAWFLSLKWKKGKKELAKFKSNSSKNESLLNWIARKKITSYDAEV